MMRFDGMYRSVVSYDMDSGGFNMRKSILVLLLVVLLSVALVTRDQENAGNDIHPKDGVTTSYETSRAQFYEVTGILLPELPDLELSDYYKSYVSGQSDYNFDIVGGSALSDDTYETLLKFYAEDETKKIVGDIASWGVSEYGKYESWYFNGRALYCALDYPTEGYSRKIRMDTFMCPGADGLETQDDWINRIWPQE